MNGFNFGMTMKKIFFAIIALAALVGCNTDMMEEVVSAPQYLTTSLEVALDDQTRVFDENLEWSWESTDQIAAYQVAGDQIVNTLSLKENGKFGTEEFNYSTTEVADFKFVYPAVALNADKTLGYVQTGKWTPTLVGTVEATTVDNIGNESIKMEHHSAAFEIRVWDENKSDRKAIKGATITSESDFCNGTTASVDNLNTDTVVFNIAEGDFAFNLTLTATDGTTYTVAVPSKNFALGKRTILNVQWKSVSLDGVSSWYDEVYNGKDSQLEGGYIYLNGFEGASAQVYVNNEPATVVDNKIAVATGTYTVYAAVGANKTAEYTITVTGKPSISFTATTSYNNNAGAILKNNTLTNGNEGKLLTISNYSCNIADADKSYFGSPVLVYGSNEKTPANGAMELAVGQYNTYIKLPIVGTSHNLKYGEAVMYVTGVPYSFTFYDSSDTVVDSAGWTRNGVLVDMQLLILKSGGLAGSDSGWIASPAYYAPNGGISTNVTLQAKYYVAALRPSSNKATLYVGATTSPKSSSSTSSSLSLTGSNNTSSNEAWSTVTTAINIPNGTQYVSINHNGATYWSGSRIYLCSYKIEYK